MKDLDETQAPLLEHLIELRTRLVRCVLALVVAFGICLYFADSILGFVESGLGWSLVPSLDRNGPPGRRLSPPPSLAPGPAPRGLGGGRAGR